LSVINVGVIGASGYTGLELVKILLKHPKFHLSYVANTEGGTTLEKLHPSLAKVASMEVQKADLDACAAA